MGLITKPYSFTNGAGNNADATQVNADFDTIYTLVNGKLEAVNMKDSIITLAKLASETKVIESVTHTPLTSNYNLTDSETTVFSQNITLSAQRYCLFLFKGLETYNTTGAGVPFVYTKLYDGATLISAASHSAYQPGSSSGNEFTLAFHTYKQLASGAHTIYVKGYYGAYASAAVVEGTAAGTFSYLTTIVLAF